MKTPLVLAALSMAMAAPAHAQDLYSDEVCMGTILFGADKATDPDTRRIVGMLEMYYLGKLRAKHGPVSLTDAVTKSVEAFTSLADKEGAVKHCMGNIQTDVVHLDTLNERMAKPDAAK